MIERPITARLLRHDERSDDAEVPQLLLQLVELVAIGFERRCNAAVIFGELFRFLGTALLRRQVEQAAQARGNEDELTRDALLITGRVDAPELLSASVIEAAVVGEPASPRDRAPSAAVINLEQNVRQVEVAVG